MLITHQRLLITHQRSNRRLLWGIPTSIATYEFLFITVYLLTLPLQFYIIEYCTREKLNVLLSKATEYKYYALPDIKN